MEITELHQLNSSSLIETINLTPEKQEIRADEKEQKKNLVRELKDSSKNISDEKEQKHIAHEISDAMNQVVKALNTHLSFKVHESTGKMIVQVIDSETGEIKRQIPPEDMLRLVDKMRTVVGILFNQEA